MKRAIAILFAVAPALAQESGPRPATAVPAGVDRATQEAAERRASEERLQRAYEKEYAFLASEERELSTRKLEVEHERAARDAAAAQSVAALEQRLAELRGQLEAERKSVAGLEARAAELDEGNDAILAVISQAAQATGFQAPALEQSSPAERLSALERALEQGLTHLTRQSTIRREAGRFFLADGREVEGQVLHVGAIAALGAGVSESGTLAPAGGGRLQLWGNGVGAEEARSAATGPLPATLPLYLYESLEHEVERPRDASFANYLRRGGDVAYVIVVLGAFVGVLIILRAAILFRAAGDPERILAEVAPHLRAGRTAEALARSRTSRSVAAQVLVAGVPHVEAGSDRLESAVSEQMLKESLRTERFEAAIMVSAALAPLLGLLGTVTGMIATFDVITVHGTGDPKLLAGGISEALITTELGLMVAIPAVLLGNLLGGWSERIRTGMERAALRLAVLSEERAERRGRDSQVDDDLLAATGPRS